VLRADQRVPDQQLSIDRVGASQQSLPSCGPINGSR
jgi:hypothetical protein